MRTVFFSIIFLFFGFLAALCQSDDLMINKVPITVFQLRRDSVIKSQTVSLTGSGVFVHKDEKDLYLVTASHVAKHMDKKAVIIVKGVDDKAIQFNLSDLAPIKWMHHKEADISVLKLPLSTIVTQHLRDRFISLRDIDSVKYSIPRHWQLTVLGFPLGLGAKDHFSPLSYRSFASSGLITLNRFDTHTPQTFIILENPSIGGYSGGPVFNLGVVQQGSMMMSQEGGFKLLGIIHGTLSDDTGGKLTAFTPSFYLRDLIK